MFLRISYAFSILVYSLANFKLSTLDVCKKDTHPLIDCYTTRHLRSLIFLQL